MLKQTILLISILMTYSLTASYQSNSSIDLDISIVYQPPGDITPEICKKHEKDPKTGENDLQAYKACQSGVAASRYMAERYAANEGRYLGCLDGFTSGLYQGYGQSVNPTIEEIEQANNSVRNSRMETAIARAEKEANEKGSSVAQGTIIKRFRDVVNTDKIPSNKYSYPAHSFEGYENGFDHDNQYGDTNSVRRSGWVNSNASGKELIEAKEIYNIQNRSYNRSICNATDTLINDEPPLTLWDYFQAKGRYNFKRYGWKDSRKTWNYFLNHLTGTKEKFTYLNLEGKQEIYEEKIPVAWEQILDENGVPTGSVDRNKPIKFRIVRKTRNVPNRGISYYQSIFKSSFKLSYDQYFVTQYFGKSFVLARNSSVSSGEIAGFAIGKAVAKETARYVAYNNKYKIDSVARFNEIWRSNFDKEWNRVWNLFINYPQVELNYFSILGSVEDDILKSGESIAAHASTTNLGRKSGKLYFELSGDIQNRSQYKTQVPAHASKEFTTPELAKINSKASPRDNISIMASVSGENEFIKEMTTRKNINLIVREEAEIKTAKIDYNDLTGIGSLYLELENPSNKENVAFVKVRLNLGKYGEYELEGLKLKAKERVFKEINFDAIDPLDVIVRGSLVSLVQTVINGRVLDERNIKFSINDTQIALSQYFTGTLTDSANLGNESKEDRVNRLISMIQRQVGKSYNDIEWDKTKEVQASLVGKIGKSYLSAKAAGKLNSYAIEIFDNLGNLLNLSFDPGYWSRKDYRRALHVFAPSVNVKKKNKKNKKKK